MWLKNITHEMFKFHFKWWGFYLAPKMSLYTTNVSFVSMNLFSNDVFGFQKSKQIRGVLQPK